jgi:sugar phosphate permease
MRSFPFSRFYYGWYIVIALSITEIISWGILFYGFSVFITPIESEMNWTRGQISGAFSLSLLVAGLFAVPVGYWLDHHGGRLLMTLGSLIGAVALGLLSIVQSLTMFYVLWAVIGVAQAALFYEPAFVVIANWFVHKRSTALAILTFSAGFASTIFLPVLDFLVQSHGWRNTLIVSAGLVFGITMPLHAFVLRKRPEDFGLRSNGYDVEIDSAQAEYQGPEKSTSFHTVVRSRAFWLIVMAFALARLSATAIRIHFIPYLIERGFNASDAAWIAGFIGASQVLGRIIFAPLDNRFPTINLSGILFGMQALAILLLIIRGEIVAVVFVVLFGAAFGAMTLARPLLLVQLYGPLEFGRITSVSALFIALAVTIGPFGAGLLFEFYGNYQPLLYALTALFVVAIGLLGAAQRFLVESKHS